MIRIGRALQAIGVILAGVGIGVAYGQGDPAGWTAAALGLVVYAAARIWPWLRGKD